jgi:hypothetical protein
MWQVLRRGEGLGWVDVCQAVALCGITGPVPAAAGCAGQQPSINQSMTLVAWQVGGWGEALEWVLHNGVRECSVWRQWYCYCYTYSVVCYIEFRFRAPNKPWAFGLCIAPCMDLLHV